MAANIDYTARLLREPLTNKGDDWQARSHEWAVTINNQDFMFYTGIAFRERRKHYSRHVRSNHMNYARYAYSDLKVNSHRLCEKSFHALLSMSKAIPPKLDDVLHALTLDAAACDMSFAHWCVDFGYDTDSRKALVLYEQCQIIGDKLVSAGIDIAAERERLLDY